MKRISLLFLSSALIVGLMATGCEYDPSLYEYSNGKSNETQTTEVFMADVIEDAILRTTPGEDAEEIDHVGAGTTVLVAGGNEDGYYYVNYYGTEGYLPASCLDIPETSEESSAPDVITATVIDNINIRRGPGTDYERIEEVPPGVVLTIIGEEENGYYPVDYNGEVGYAHRNYIQINEPVEGTDDGPADGVITFENNPTFAEIMTLTDEYDERIGEFFNNHIGDVIEFDGYIAAFDYHGSYTTRYDVLVAVGDNDGPLVGPPLHYTNVSFFSDMSFDENTPDYLSVNDEFRFTAEIESYNESTGLVELDPVSTVYRGS